MQGNVYTISSTFSRCNIYNENFGLYNTTDGSLKTIGMSLTWSVDCKSTIEKKIIRAYEDFRM